MTLKATPTSRRTPAASRSPRWRARRCAACMRRAGCGRAGRLTRRACPRGERVVHRRARGPVREAVDRASRAGARCGGCCRRATSASPRPISTATGRTPDLTRAARASAPQRARSCAPTGDRLRWRASCSAGLRHRCDANTRRGSRRNIAVHYDLGNEFYRHWLDRRHDLFVARSSPRPDQTLEEAQEAKLDRIVELLDLARRRATCSRSAAAGARSPSGSPRVTAAASPALTLSTEQLAYARRRARAARRRPTRRSAPAGLSRSSTAASTASSRSRCSRRSASATGRSISTDAARPPARRAASPCCR